ncbi:helix-turn-helix domain-containing protein [Arthrobacter sp. NPDC056886]|uniref:helix-turn-helix domain-containing protein n=1 Tax=Arthrobacter sp. NPDC056886 TaxID=3345960 RepID=UPI00366D1610
MVLHSLFDVPQRQRAEALRSSFRDGDASAEFRVGHDRGLGGHFGASRIGELTVAEVLINGVDSSLHRQGKPGEGDLEVLLFNTTDAGRSAVHQNGHQVSLPPAHMVLTSTRFDLEARQWGSSHRYSIVIPYRTLGLPDELVDSLVASRLPIDESLSSTVSGFLMRAVHQSIRGDAAMALFSPPIVDMVRSVILAAAGSAERAREPLADTLFRRIMDYVRLHLLDPGLSAAGIAHAHDISVRYLYVILARESLSLGAWIREQRAHHAAGLLTDSAHNLSIADIAYRTGYADQAHFSRSFRRWYGTSPREWRRRHR